MDTEHETSPTTTVAAGEGDGPPPDRDPRRLLGDRGEDLAAQYLTESGLEVVDRNWRCPQGEIDLVALDGECLVVCEVKTRTSTAFGDPVEGVTRVKLARLRRLALAWLTTHDVYAADLRIDVVGILVRPDGPPLLTHLRGVQS
ncbi:YraN family protein [Janibacter sp. G1551]|uniref:YraN family protein n=1 Tax=Janibacter sp. G1551 TaxID=3420440 RepID=UPI003D02E4FD